MQNKTVKLFVELNLVDLKINSKNSYYQIHILFKSCQKLLYFSEEIIYNFPKIFQNIVFQCFCIIVFKISKNFAKKIFINFQEFLK